MAWQLNSAEYIDKRFLIHNKYKIHSYLLYIMNTYLSNVSNIVLVSHLIIQNVVWIVCINQTCCQVLCNCLSIILFLMHFECFEFLKAFLNIFKITLIFNFARAFPLCTLHTDCMYFHVYFDFTEFR